MTRLHEQYYKLIITELAGILPVTTCQDAFSTTGHKLVSKGVRIDSTFADKLGRHDILPPLEQCLVVDSGIDIEQIVMLARNLMQTRPPLMRMAAKLQNTDVLFDTLRQVSLSEPMIFLLTLARERRLALLVHRVTVALVCLYLGIRCGLGPKQMLELASAGLLHDIGELRIDERLLREGAHPRPAEREQIYTHPATSQRLSVLNKATREVGINTSDNSGVIDGIGGDEACLAELHQVNLEVLRQITETIFEVQRRWPNYQDDQTLVGQAVSGWMQYMQGLLLENLERGRTAH